MNEWFYVLLNLIELVGAHTDEEFGKRFVVPNPDQVFDHTGITLLVVSDVEKAGGPELSGLKFLDM